MVKPCRSTTAPPFGCASRASSATRTPNFFRASSSPTAWTISASASARAAPKAATPGTAAFDATANSGPRLPTTETLRVRKARPSPELFFIHSEGLPCRFGRHLTYPGLAVVAHAPREDALHLHQIVLTQPAAIIGGVNGPQLALQHII